MTRCARGFTRSASPRTRTARPAVATARRAERRRPGAPLSLFGHQINTRRNTDKAIEMSERHEQIDWKEHGVKVIPGDQLDPNTAQTPGMDRAAAINLARVGAQKIWAGTVKIHANAKTGAHHHGRLESVIYVLKGRARMRWGEHLEYVAEAGPGDFIFVPPYVPHQEI